MKNTTLSILGVLALGASAQAQTAWLPEVHKGSVTTAFSYSNYEKFRVGNTRLKSPTGDSVDHYSVLASVEFGLASNLALDISSGYTWVRDDAFTGTRDSGIDDSRIGLRLGITRDEGLMPAIAVRVGAIIAGNYDDGAIYSIGDGANGVEASVLFAKTLGAGFALVGDIGFRWRDKDVPDDFFFSAGVMKSFALSGGDSINLYAGYRDTAGQSGPDIGAPGFGTAFGFPQVKERQQGVDFSLGYTDRGGRTYTAGYSTVVDGRNTPEREVLSLSFSVPF